MKDIERLALFVSPLVSKSWHFRFTLQGKTATFLLYHHSYPKLLTNENTLNYGAKRLGLMAFNEAWDSGEVVNATFIDSIVNFE